MHSQTLHDGLRRLAPHVDLKRLALTGGVAIGIHAVRCRASTARTTSADDIDLVADAADAVRPTVSREYLISHFHVPQPDYSKFLIQLVDPSARLRLDIFPDAFGSIARARPANFAGVPLRVLEAEDILSHKLGLLRAASEAAPVDPKHYADATLLAEICGREMPMAVSSSLLALSIRSQDITTACPRCEASRNAAFPLAPKRAILDILGYV